MMSENRKAQLRRKIVYSKELTALEKRYLLELMMTKQTESNSESGWIPCSERLPNNDERCIVFMSDGNIQFGWWDAQYYDGGHDGGVWCVLYPGKPAKLFRIKNVPYWMPLPEPPGGEET